MYISGDGVEMMSRRVLISVLLCGQVKSEQSHCRVHRDLSGESRVESGGWREEGGGWREEREG